MAADNSAEVRLGANTTELNAGMTAAEIKVTQSTTAITSAVERMSVQSVAAVRTMKDSINSHMTAISGAVSKMNGVILGVTAVLAGGAMFGKVISDTISWTGEVVKLSKNLGITTQEASGLNAALTRIGVSSDTYTAAAQRLNRQVIANEEKLNKMGLTTRDANGSILDQQSLMMNAVKTLNDYEQGSNRNMAAQKLFGRGVGDVSSLMKMLGSDFETAKKRAAELGLEVGPDGAAKARQYKEGLADVKLIAKALELQVGNALLPVLIELGKYFSSTGPSSINIFRNGLNGIASGLIILKAAVSQFLLDAKEVGAVGSAALTGDWGKIPGIVKSYESQIDEVIRKEKTSLARLWGDLDKDINHAVQPKSGGSGQFDPGSFKEKTSKEKAPDSVMALWEDELKRKQIKEEQWFGISLQDERSFWEKKLQIASQKNNDYNSVVGKINDTILKQGQKNAQAQLETLREEMADTKASWADRLKAATQYADLIKKLYRNDQAAYAKALQEGTRIFREQEEERQRIQQGTYETKRQLSDADLEMERESIEAMRSMGFISAEQEVAALRDLEDRKYALELDYLEKLKALNRDKVEEVARINNQIALLEKNHNKNMHSLDLKAASDSTAIWRSAYSSTASNVSSALQSMATSGTSFKQAMLDLSKAVLNTFIDLGVQVAANWLMRQLGMTAVTATQSAVRTGISVAADATTATSSASSGAASVSTNAGVAASGAAASVSSIPYVGPILAAAAAAAMLALVMGYMAYVKSASGGWGQIPEDQLSMVHKDEMILPAELASGVRAMISSGNKPGVSPSTSKTNISIKAFDAKDVVKTLKQLKRNNSFSYVGA